MFFRTADILTLPSYLATFGRDNCPAIQPAHQRLRVSDPVISEKFWLLIGLVNVAPLEGRVSILASLKRNVL